MSNRSKMAKSAVAMSMISVVSLAFSFLKESVFAYYFGASSMTDAFTIAIQIPTTLFSLVSTAIGNVALPYYAREMANSGEEKASRYVSNLMTIVTLLSITIVATLELIPGIVISVFAPGLSTESSYLFSWFATLVVISLCLPESSDQLLPSFLDHVSGEGEQLAISNDASHSLCLSSEKILQHDDALLFGCALVEASPVAAAPELLGDDVRLLHSLPQRHSQPSRAVLSPTTQRRTYTSP